MSSDTGDVAISAKGVGKRYQVGQQRDPYGRLTETLWAALRSPSRWFGRGPQDDREWFWALDDVSFDITRGAVVGIIGRNGAGKTTLLKLLSRITEPTVGLITMRGRVGSLLEVGTGFHPELTGRENIVMSSAVFGMTRAEISRKFDEIVDFAGASVEALLDTPVKRYSSGMQLRLGFSVAAHLEPEILIVDEVLAVGDAAFQKKCLGKMEDVAHQGRTVLLVSHNLAAVETLCERAIWIEKGRIAADGPATDVVRSYLSSAAPVSAERRWPNLETAPGNAHVRLRSANVRPRGGDTGDEITRETPVLIEFEYWNLQPTARLDLILEIYNQQRVLVIHTASFDDSSWTERPLATGLFRTQCVLPPRLLNGDVYSVTLRVVRDEGHPDITLEDAVSFEVSERNERMTYHKWLGAVRPELDWTTEMLDVSDDERRIGDQELQVASSSRHASREDRP